MSIAPDVPDFSFGSYPQGNKLLALTAPPTETTNSSAVAYCGATPSLLVLWNSFATNAKPVVFSVGFYADPLGAISLGGYEFEMLNGGNNQLVVPALGPFCNVEFINGAVPIIQDNVSVYQVGVTVTGPTSVSQDILLNLPSQSVPVGTTRYDFSVISPGLVQGNFDATYTAGNVQIVDLATSQILWNSGAIPSVAPAVQNFQAILSCNHCCLQAFNGGAAAAACNFSVIAQGS